MIDAIAAFAIVVMLLELSILLIVWAGRPRK